MFGIESANVVGYVDHLKTNGVKYEPYGCPFITPGAAGTTFRLYDWGRVGADGRPRRLHVKEALAALDMSLPTPTPTESVSCEYFDFRKVKAGKIEPSDQWRVAYTPSTRRSLLLPPGAATEVDAPSFLTIVK